MSASQDKPMEMTILYSPNKTHTNKFKRNKISTPPIQSPIMSSQTSGNDIFVLPPVPKRRNLNKTKETSLTNSLDKSEMTYKSCSDAVTENSISGHPESFITRSDTKSYRDKIKERFNAVKKRAGPSTSHEQYNFRTQTNRIVSIHKSLELMKQENMLIDKEIKGHKNRMTDKTTISAADKYIFFCEDISDTNDTAEKKCNNENQIDKSTQDLIKISDDNQLIEFILPDKLEDYVKIAENDLFWYPLRKVVSIHSKLEYDEPRLLIEEGLYISDLPHIPYLNILEQRLLSLDDKKWFNCEGNLKMIENPLSRTSYRPKSSQKYNLQTEYMLPSIIENNDNRKQSVISKPDILEINISNIKFKHHPLFSAEHVFERQLMSLYDTYKEIITTKKIERISKRLEALRNSQNISQSLKESNYHIKNINEVKKLRELLFTIGKDYRDVIKLILQTWRIIRKIRDLNSYSNTSIKLTIHKEKCDYEEEKKCLEEQFEQVYSEIIMELEDDYKYKIIEYKDKVQKWKATNHGDVLDQSIKPKKPTKNINKDNIIEDLRQKFNESFKPPGEPILHFTVSSDNVISQHTGNEKEELRRHAVKSTKIFFKILCDNIEVCKSKSVILNDTFTCYFDESFPLLLSNVPEYMTVEIYEHPRTLLKRKIGQLALNIPHKNVSLHANKIQLSEFIQEEIVHYKHEAVGSGQEVLNIIEKYDSLCIDKKFCTAGLITYRTQWEDSSKNIIEITNTIKTQKIIHEQVLNDDGFIDVYKLTEWMEQTNLDPQDPKNSVLFEYIDSCSNIIPSEETNKYYRCNPYLQQLNLYDYETINKNVRFQVLELRNNNEPEFTGMVVPNRIKEIPINVLTAYKKRIHEEQSSFIVDAYFNNKDIDIKRSHGRKYLKQIYTKIFQLCRSTENNLLYEDIVDEKLISYFEEWIKTFTKNIINWFRIKPDISKQLPKMAKLEPQPGQSQEVVSSTKVVVNVISALNIPKRKSVKIQCRSSSKILNNESPIVEETFTFVEVSYQNMLLQTNSKHGSNPTWGEELVFPLESSNTDYLSPNSLNGSITLNLYDEVLDTSEKKQTNWLGYVQIPLSAICHNDKMEGFFQLISPFLLNYEQNIDKFHSQSSRIASHTNIHYIYLSLKLKIEPKTPRLTINMEELLCSEPPYLRKHILEWNEKYNYNFPQRKFSAFAIDTNGKTICLTRYIRPLEPPQMNIDDFDVTPEQCARYVSLIPFTDCNKIYDNVWLSTQQMMKLMLGSTIDHAIALTCYFLALNLETWLLLGYGLPHGVTAYVLVCEYSGENDICTYVLYDTVTAIKYSINDPFIPLKKIFCTVNEKNIWANVQRTDDISATRFDFSIRSDWLPLFNDQLTAPSNSMQEQLNYCTDNDYDKLEFQLEKKIRKIITKLRRTEQTLWNHQISGYLKNVVVKSEYNYMTTKFDINSQIHNIPNSYMVNGFVMDLPYTNLSTMVNIIKSTQMFNVEVPNIEFISAIHKHTYPNDVYVIWLIIGFVKCKQ